jgi:hypothetical protein
MTNSLPPETSGHDAPPRADAASQRENSIGEPLRGTIDSAASLLSEQLLSDYKQIIQQIADAQPSPEDRVKFAEHLIHALGEEGFQNVKGQMEKEHHPLRHIMTEIHNFVKKHGADVLITMIVPGNVLGIGVPQSFPPPSPGAAPIQLAPQHKAAHSGMTSQSRAYVKPTPSSLQQKILRDSPNVEADAGE